MSVGLTECDMKMKNKIHFTKMHGCGNDYIYVDCSVYDIKDPCAAARAWSDRHRGVGSDGLVLMGRSTMPQAEFSMRIFNADGSEAMMCGNAARCVGKYLYERGLTDQKVIRLETLSGIKTLWLHVVGDVVERVTVDMGEPVLEDESLFLRAFDIGCGVFVSMGNPHYVIFTDDVDDVAETGRDLESHRAFPQRCNIELAHVQPVGGETADHTVIRARVWERGSGITQACGTGACATAVAAARLGLAGRSSRIVMDGGELCVEWREQDHHVYLTGPAEFVFDGSLDEV